MIVNLSKCDTLAQVRKIMTIFSRKIKLGKSFKVFIQANGEQYELEYFHDGLVCYIWGDAINESCDVNEFMKDIMNNRITEELILHINIQKDLLKEEENDKNKSK